MTGGDILNFPASGNEQSAEPAVLSLVILDAVPGFSRLGEIFLQGCFVEIMLLFFLLNFFAAICLITALLFFPLL